MRRRINAFIRRECAAGHQAYIVCPAVEDGETDTLKSAAVWAETLQRAVFPELRVGLLHGRMKGHETEAALAAFARHETDSLVATTVVEVGVDVPNATLMVIENAERFGLSQLHQLRGRVGRGSAKSYCVLFSDTKNADTRARLKALCATNDGFAIAEQDLALRGPGDFFGSRQHRASIFGVIFCAILLQYPAEHTLQAFQITGCMFCVYRGTQRHFGNHLLQETPVHFTHGTPQFQNIRSQVLRHMYHRTLKNHFPCGLPRKEALAKHEILTYSGMTVFFLYLRRFFLDIHLQ